MIRPPNYPEITLTEAGARVLAEVHDFDQGARSDADGRRERVYHPGPGTGRAARALVDKGLLRYASASGSSWVGLEATAAGCVVLADLRRAELVP